MIFSKPKKEVIAFTVEKCSNCNKALKRKFKEGDILFSKTKECNSCSGGGFTIEMIYGETIEQQ